MESVGFWSEAKPASRSSFQTGGWADGRSQPAVAGPPHSANDCPAQDVCRRRRRISLAWDCALCASRTRSTAPRASLPPVARPCGWTLSARGRKAAAHHARRAVRRAGGQPRRRAATGGAGAAGQSVVRVAWRTSRSARQQPKEIEKPSTSPPTLASKWISTPFSTATFSVPISRNSPLCKGPDTSVKIVSGSLPELGVVTWSPLEGKPVTGVRPGRPNTGH